MTERNGKKQWMNASLTEEPDATKSEVAISREKFKRLEEQRLAEELRENTIPEPEVSESRSLTGFGFGLRVGSGKRSGWSSPERGCCSVE